MNNVLIRKKNKKITTFQTHKQAFCFLEWADKLLIGLDKRTRQIIKKRFGLLDGQRETLEKIGQQYNITRERVRQIILKASKHITAKLESEPFKKAEEKILFTISQNSGIIREIDVFDKFNLSDNDKKEASAIKFFIAYSPKVVEIKNKGILEKSWAISENIVVNAKKVILEAQKILERDKKLLTSKEICRRIIFTNPSFSKDQIIDFLSVASKVKENKFGKWGKSDWTEITPKGTREKAYLILKEKKQPLHFTEIAELITQYRLGKRKANPQTVHNELIKNSRFVLIGRGIYALREWGYSKGTVKEVLKKILKESQKPLDKKEIIEKVLKIRKVRKATIMINLNDAQTFSKKGNLYTIKNK